MQVLRGMGVGQASRGMGISVNHDSEYLGENSVGYRRLFAAIIFRAILDSFKLYAETDESAKVKSKRTMPMHEEAYRWIFGTDDDDEFTCADACEAIGIDIESLREKKKRVHDGQLYGETVTPAQIRGLFSLPAVRSKPRSFGYFQR